MPDLSANEIAELVSGTIVAGNPDLRINGVESLARARPRHAAYFTGKPALKPDFEASRAGVMLVPPGTAKPDRVEVLITVKDPDDAFTKVCVRLLPRASTPVPGVHPTAVVPASVQLGKDVHLGPNVVLGENVVIGDGTVLHGNCTILEGCRIGARCLFYPNVVMREFCVVGNDAIFQPGVVIGSDGFGYRFKDGDLRAIPQLGIVEIGDRVHLGANTTVDRARFGKTVIGSGTKIDNQVQIAHNVTIGVCTAIAAHSAVAGSSTIGDFVDMSGASRVIDHINVGAGAKLRAAATLYEHVPPGEERYGTPAQTRRDYFAGMLSQAKLPELLRRVKRIEASLGISSRPSPASPANGAGTADQTPAAPAAATQQAQGAARPGPDGTGPNGTGKE